MTKRRKAVLTALVSLLILALCLAGVTGAYLVSTSDKANTFTVGEVKFDPKEDLSGETTPVKPGNSYTKHPYVVNTGNLPIRLRARVIFSDSLAADICTLDYNTASWTYDADDDFWYYTKVLDVGSSCKNDALFSKVTYNDNASGTALDGYELSIYFEAVEDGGSW